MEIKQVPAKIWDFVGKYRYALIVLVVGVLLIMLPGKKNQQQKTQQTEVTVPKQTINEESLAQILQTIHGAGKVNVLLSIASSAETFYQTDTDTSSTGEDERIQIETVLVTDSQRNQTGLIRKIHAPAYLGAIVVCEGADSAAVKLSIIQAVSKVTGLGADHICVLKMK